MEDFRGDPEFKDAIEEMSMGSQEVARDSFLELARKYPDAEYITYMLGIIYYGLGDLQKSIEYCRKTVALRQDSGNAHYRMGVCYFRMGKFDESLREFKLSEEIQGSRQAMVYYYMARISMHLGKDEDAIRFFEQLREASPQTKMALFVEAELLMKKQLFDRAVELLEEFLEVSPDFAEAHYMLGVSHMGLHQNMKALKSYSKALELDPNDKRSQRAVERLTDPD